MEHTAWHKQYSRAVTARTRGNEEIKSEAGCWALLMSRQFALGEGRSGTRTRPAGELIWPLRLGNGDGGGR
jgi:hypothetical protein